MSSPGFSQSGQFTYNAQGTYKLQLAAALAKIKPSASWFDWIAILSVVNAVIAIANGGLAFLVGLGVTREANAMAARGEISPGASLIITGIAAAFFWFMGRLTKAGQKWALIIGMLFYAVDGLILLQATPQPWLMIAFHVYALIMLAKGLSAFSAVDAVRAAAQANGVVLD